MAKQVITEQDGAQSAWYAAARQMTPADVPEFLRHLSEDFEHDYGTICHALAAGAVGAAHALNATKQGGITGFQAGAVMWEFIIHWMRKTGPLRLLEYANMLYPQYETTFRAISGETWNWLQEQAREKLADHGEYAVDDVIEHWQSIVDGVVPFGLYVWD